MLLLSISAVTGCTTPSPPSPIQGEGFEWAAMLDLVNNVRGDDEFSRVDQ
jgi:hypothetical protein